MRLFYSQVQKRRVYYGAEIAGLKYIFLKHEKYPKVFLSKVCSANYEIFYKTVKHVRPHVDLRYAG